MKIEELYRPKISNKLLAPANKFAASTTDLYSYKQMKKDFLKLGWKEIGIGMYAAVFANPNKSFVLKVVHMQDKGYEEYANLIKRHRNKHFPIISDRKKIEIRTAHNVNSVYVYMIEKLKPTGKASWTFAEVFDNIMHNPTIELDKLFTIYTKNKYRDVIEMLKNNPSLVKALRILGKNRWDSSMNYVCGIDMHSGNIMQRKDGTIVITDPYVG